MSKTKYNWTEKVADERIGTIKFSTGQIYKGDMDFHELQASRYPSEGLPLRWEDWEKIEKGEKVVKKFVYVKTFEIEKVEDE